MPTKPGLTGIELPRHMLSDQSQPNVGRRSTTIARVFVYVRQSSLDRSKAASRHLRSLDKGLRAIAALSVAAVVLGGCGDTCSNDLISSVPSPSGHVRAVVFSRECGATVGSNIQVSLVDGTEQPEGSGNVAVFKDNVALRLRWQSETELIVAGAAATEPFKREVVVGAVRIRYE